MKVFRFVTGYANPAGVYMSALDGHRDYEVGFWYDGFKVLVRTDRRCSGLGNRPRVACSISSIHGCTYASHYVLVWPPRFGDMPLYSRGMCFETSDDAHRMSWPLVAHALPPHMSDMLPSNEHLNIVQRVLIKRDEIGIVPCLQ